MKNQMPVIQVKSLSKHYNERIIINNLSFEIYSGSVVSLLGMNGAGKSTLIKMMLGLSKPTKGKVSINGLSPIVPESRQRVGAALQQCQFAEELTVKEVIQFVKKHYKKSQSLNNLVDCFNLREFINLKTAVLSDGQKRKLALALAFLHEPKIVFLDEPTVGLDAQSRSKLWDFIKSYRKSDRTIILTTHYLADAKSLSDRILILRDGEITLDSSLGRVEEVHQLC